MNWTDLQENYAALTDADKFRRYAKECRLEKASEGSDKDSYFEADRGSFYDNIAVYNYTNIPDIEREIMRISRLTGLKEDELIARVAAVTMLKMKPSKLSEREGANAPTPEQTEEKAQTKADRDAPPDFYYPM